MAHKVLVGGTAYEIKCGLALVNGTDYSIEKGRTLINGTGYDIKLPTKRKLKISLVTEYDGLPGLYIYINNRFIGDMYADPDYYNTDIEYEVYAGDSIEIIGDEAEFWSCEGFVDWSEERGYVFRGIMPDSNATVYFTKI